MDRPVPSRALRELAPRDHAAVIMRASIRSAARAAEWLRIVSINDIYDISNFPAFAALLKDLRVGPNKTLVTVNGDFLSPNVLSPLDKGRSMIDCFNRLGVTHVCLGNHEGDLGLKELKRRSAEFKGVWLNSNIPGLAGTFRPWDLVTTPGGRRVGLLGLLLCEPGAFRDGTFKGHTIDNVTESARRWTHFLREEHQADLVIPVTHQSMTADESLAAAGLHLPIILGGHEHELMLRGPAHSLISEDATGPPENCPGLSPRTTTLPRAALNLPDSRAQGGTAAWSLIVKAGQDCNHAAVCDIHFPDQGAAGDVEADTAAQAGDVQVHTQGLSVSVFFEDVAALTAKNHVCEEMERAVESHLEVVEVLRNEVVVWLRETEERLLPLSSVGTRLRPSTVASLLCEACRKELDADCCVINGASIMGNRNYPAFSYPNEEGIEINSAHMTYAQLKEELPFPTKMVTVRMPGKVIAEAVEASREAGPQGVEKRGFLQVGCRMAAIVVYGGGDYVVRPDTT